MTENNQSVMNCPNCGESIDLSAQHMEEVSENSNTSTETNLNWEEQLKEKEDKYLRLFAEFDNYKRRTAREFLEIRQTAGRDVIISLLDVLDDCDRAEKQIRTSGELTNAAEGTLLVFNKLKTTLFQKGLKPMDSLGEDFDVEKHEAITQIEVDDSKKGKVVDDLMKGYYLNDKIIRFAKVVVGK